MAIDLLPDELWAEVEPLLRPHRAQPKGGRRWAEDRRCLLGIIFVLRTGMPWRMIPKELDCASGSTCWRRLRDWTLAGVWTQVHQRLLNRLGKLGEIDWSRGIIDSSSVRAVLGGSTRDPTPRIGRRTAVNAT